MFKPRTRKCQICRTEYKPFSSWQKLCGNADCAVAWAEKEAAKKEKRSLAERKVAHRKELAADRAKKEKLKRRSDWMKEAQIAFNAFIRLRDAGKPCICCGKPLGEDAIGGGYDCGHYRSVGSAPHLRFDERNAHAQRKQCNRYGAGRAVDYRVGLIARLGVSVVDELESDQSVKKWTIDDLKAIRDHYRAKTKALKAGVADSATNVAKTATYKPCREEAYQLMGAAFQREGE